MAGRRVWSVLIPGIFLGCGPSARDSAPSAAYLEGLLPDATFLDGWSAAEGPTAYTPETLYEYIDGAAPLYQKYGFRRLVHVRYELEGDPLASVTLDLFDMGSPLGAFGIYRSVRPIGAAHRPWGTEGHRSGNVAAAWRGSVYAHAEADDDRPALVEMVDRLLSHVGAAAGGDTSLPSIVRPLPPDGMVRRSERYVPQDLLGHAFLPGGVLATYREGGAEARLFLSDLGNEAAAVRALALLREHQQRWSAIEPEVVPVGDDGFSFTESGGGSGVVVRAGRHLAGAHGDLGREGNIRLLRGLIERIEP